MKPTRGFEFVSAAATRMTGYTPEEHYADPDLGVKLVHPDDRWMLAALTEMPSMDPVVIRWRRKDGATIWTEQRNTPVFDDEGELVAIEGIAREIADPTTLPGGAVRVLGGVRIDFPQQRVVVDGAVVHLTQSEFKLLALLTSRPGEVFSRRELMQQLWESHHAGGDHACETHISALRRKVERDPRFPERIHTVRGRGYRYVPDSAGEGSS